MISLRGERAGDFANGMIPGKNVVDMIVADLCVFQRPEHMGLSAWPGGADVAAEKSIATICW